MSKCNHKNCPIQYDKISNDCDVKECPYRTEDPPKIMHRWIGGDICSSCGISKYNFISFNFHDPNGYAKPFGTWNFCPKCGADMREKNDRESNDLRNSI